MAHASRGVCWHTLQGVIFNDKPLFEVDDSAFTEPGMVGLWTKADSVTVFDAFAYGEAK
jgi:hypothetical protein